MSFEEIKGEIENAPDTWIPALLQAVALAALKMQVFKPGGMARIVSAIEASPEISAYEKMFKESRKEKLPFPRKDCLESLYELRDEAAAAERAKDPAFRCWPDLDALLEFIDKNGFPPP